MATAVFNSKTTLAVALCLLPAAAAAGEWSYVSTDGFSTIFIDPGSQKTAPDGRVRVEALTDYDPAAPAAADFGLAQKGLSEVESVELDCRRNLYRSAGGAWFREHMGRGEIAKRYEAGRDFAATPPYYEKLFARLCAPILRPPS